MKKVLTAKVYAEKDDLTVKVSSSLGVNDVSSKDTGDAVAESILAALDNLGHNAQNNTGDICNVIFKMDENGGSINFMSKEVGDQLIKDYGTDFNQYLSVFQMRLTDALDELLENILTLRDSEKIENADDPRAIEGVEY